MIEIIFYLSVAMVLYIYLGYPFCVSVFSVVRRKAIQKESKDPLVTILIAAYNEKDCIEQTLQNKLELDYPAGQLEIIVISDGSTDGTDNIVDQYKDKGVRLLRQEPRAGKTSALNWAFQKATGEILVFSDANSIYAKNALKNLNRNFSDPSVGYVTGKMIYTNSDGSIIGDGCSAYMKYENRLREFETGFGSIVGVDGGIDAIRKELYKPMNPDQLPDFVLPLKVIEQGYRVVYEPEAILKEPSLKEPADEYSMRVRVSLRAIWALSDMRHLLSFKAYSLFAWQLWSHKVLRYLCFVFLLMAYATNVVLFSAGLFYKICFLLQTTGYLGALASPYMDKKGYNIKLLYLLYYFVLLNVASAHAFMKFLFRQKMVTWTPRKG